MRVILVHNASAGRGDHDLRALSDEIRRAGYTLLHELEEPNALASRLGHTCDLVVIAGGDGTVDKVVQILGNGPIPFTILPLGTANNIARALGIEGEPAALIRAWDTYSLAPFDVAVAHSGGRRRTFIEGFGFGVFPMVIDQTEARDDPPSPEARLARDLAVLEARIVDAPLEHYVVKVDGEDHSGAYLMVEVLNIPFIGPGFTLAPGASARDGALDVVLVGVPERTSLLRAIKAHRRGRAPTTELPSLRARHVMVHGAGRPHHVDGKLFDDAGITLDVHVEREALRVLRPPT